MTHDETLILAATEVIRTAHGEATDRELAVLVLDEIRAREDDAMKVVWQKVADTAREAIAESDVYKLNENGIVSLTKDVTDAILEEFHVSMRADRGSTRSCAACHKPDPGAPHP